MKYEIYSRAGEFVGKFESVNIKKEGGVNLFDRSQKLDFIAFYDRKNNKVMKGADNFEEWKKWRIEFEKNNPSVFNVYENITHLSSGTMSKDWMEQAKSYLFNFKISKRLVKSSKDLLLIATKKKYRIG
jgi:hypothetical protein